MMEQTKPSRNFVAGIILMGVGGLFFFAQLLGGTFWSYFWPYPIIVGGLAFFVGMFARGHGAGGLAIPGSIITTLGVMLFFQNLLGWWESWAFAWTTLIIATGIGIYVMGVWNYSEGARRNGMNIAAIGAALLLLFGAFFGLGFSFLGFGFAARVIVPLAMIVVGAYLIMGRSKMREITALTIINKPLAPADQPVSQPVAPPVAQPETVTEEPRQNSAMQPVTTSV